MQTLFAAVAMFAFVFLKAFQQRNVAFDKYVPVIPTSLAMAFCEVYVIALVARHGYELTLTVGIGLGAGLGALLAMYTHRRVFR